VPWRAGTALFTPTLPISSGEVIDRLVASGSVVIDIDLLFWRFWLSLDPLSVLRVVAHRRPGNVVSWPGMISGGRASYSGPARRDWYEATFDNAVLRPKPTSFPDDPPYRIERIP
jgi:hypothetical protein